MTADSPRPDASGPDASRPDAQGPDAQGPDVQGSGGHAPPRDVATAFYLWVVSLGVSLVGQVLGMPSIDEAVGRATAGSPVPGDAPMSPQTMQSIAKVGMAFGIAVMVATIALLLFFGFRMRAGRGWARVVIAVLVGIDAVFVLVNLRDTSMWQAVSLVLAAASVYFSYRPGAREHFARGASPTE